jgi:photosystem II stability/assembly factor-like uncharacterized protein
LTVDPLNPGTVYASTSGGVFKSTDAGTSWAATGAGVRGACLAVDPMVPDVLYWCVQPDGVFKSTYGGSSWRSINSGLTGFLCTLVSALIIEPQSPSTIYAASHCGVFKSVDAGASWSAISSGLGGLGIFNLAIDPQDSSTL